MSYAKMAVVLTVSIIFGPICAKQTRSCSTQCVCLLKRCNNREFRAPPKVRESEGSIRYRQRGNRSSNIDWLNGGAPVGHKDDLREEEEAIFEQYTGTRRVEIASKALS